MTRPLPHDLAAPTWGELLRRIEALAIEVDPTPNKRTKQSKEWYTLRCAASSFGFAPDYGPARVSHGDRPDFHLEMGPSLIGIEVSELTTRNRSLLNAVLQELGDVQGRPTALSYDLVDDEEALTKAEIRSRVLAAQMGRGYTGDEPERQLASAILSTVLNKSGRLHDYGGQRFAEFWLLLYDNLSLPGCHFDRVRELLRAGQVDLGTTGFSRIIVANEARAHVI